MGARFVCQVSLWALVLLATFVGAGFAALKLLPDMSKLEAPCALFLHRFCGQLRHEGGVAM